MHRTWFQTFTTVLIMLLITTMLYLYTSGYRIGSNENSIIDLQKTGIVSAKSIPEGATVYLDGKAQTATNDTIAGVKPGKHELKIIKKGFVEWVKEIEVFEEMATDITAVLVSQTPRIEPLTNTGAYHPSLSPTLNKIAYFSKEAANPGIRVLLLDQSGIGLFKSNPDTLIKDTIINKYSEGQRLEWAPDEREILVTMSENFYFIIDIESRTARTIYDPNVVRNNWKSVMAKKRLDFTEKLEIPTELRDIANTDSTIWSPDQKKFLYSVEEANQILYKVHNMEKPLPIGEKVDTIAFSIEKNSLKPEITWYSDSFHLVITFMDKENENKGAVYMVRIDGTNKTELFNNTLYDNKAYVNPSGDKIIVLTGFKSTGQTDLYTISIH